MEHGAIWPTKSNGTLFKGAPQWPLCRLLVLIPYFSLCLFAIEPKRNIVDLTCLTLLSIIYIPHPDPA